MKLISWNVNGLRACLGKGFTDYFAQQDADFFCLQETKMQPGQAQIPAPDYVEFFNSARKKAIPARRFSPGRRRFRSKWAWTAICMTMKGG